LTQRDRKGLAIAVLLVGLVAAVLSMSGELRRH